MEDGEKRPPQGEAELPAQGAAEVPPQGEAEVPAQGQAEVPPRGEAELPPRGPGVSRHLVTAAVAAGVLLFALAFFMAGFGARTLLDEDGGSGSGSGSGSGDEAITEGVAKHDPAWGPEDATVVVQEFADFQCPYCGKFALETAPRLKEAYGDKIRFVFRDFPLSSIHSSAQKAAEAGQCAQDQGLFWEYHDLLFDNQDAIADSDLRGYAEDVGADMGKFNDCLDSGKNAREVLLDAQDGRKAGVSGTPAFLINELLLSGAQPFEQFQLAIDQALAAVE
jgi:protein-disulfide isomerase